MIHMLQPALTEDEFIKLSCALILDCYAHGMPVTTPVLVDALQFHLPPAELEVLLKKCLPGLAAIQMRREADAA